MSIVMAGRDPPIRADASPDRECPAIGGPSCGRQGIKSKVCVRVDGRDERGHDEGGSAPRPSWPASVPAIHVNTASPENAARLRPRLSALRRVRVDGPDKRGHDGGI